MRFLRSFRSSVRIWFILVLGLAVALGSHWLPTPFAVGLAAAYLLVAGLVGHSIYAPVGDMERGMREISSRLDLTFRTFTWAGDEVGEVSRSVNSFLTALDEAMGKVKGAHGRNEQAASSQEIAESVQGAADMVMEVDRAFEVLARVSEEFKGATGSVEGAMRDLEATAKELGRAIGAFKISGASSVPALRG
jgi:methyl-accepting chemotaxis protein